MKMTLEEYKRLGKEAFQEAFKIRPSFLKATRTLEAYFTGKETDTAKAKAAFEVLKRYASLREKGMRTITEKLESIMPLQKNPQHTREDEAKTQVMNPGERYAF